MNRPKINDYALKDGAYSLKYVTDLEKYCNVLEERCNVLEKALDNASVLLANIVGSCHREYFNMDMQNEICTKKCEYGCENQCWRDFLLKEAQDEN